MRTLSRCRTCLKSAPDRRASRSRGVVQSRFLTGGGEDGSFIVALLSSGLSGSICSLTGDVNSSLNASRAHAVDIWRKANRASPWRTSAAHRPQSLDNLQQSSADDVIIRTRSMQANTRRAIYLKKAPAAMSRGELFARRSQIPSEGKEVGCANEIIAASGYSSQ